MENHLNQMLSKMTGGQDGTYDVNSYVGILNELPSRFYIEDGDYVDGQVILLGRIVSGRVRVGDTMCISNENCNFSNIEIKGVVMFGKILIQGETGDHCGILLSEDVLKSINPGDVLTGN